MSQGVTPSISIIGAGLSGLCLAQALTQAGYETTIYERDAGPFVRRQGYRITVDEHGLGALKQCLPAALFELVLATAGPSGGYFHITNAQLDEIFSLRFASGAPDDLTAPRQVDRTTLRAILMQELEAKIQYGKRVTDLRPSAQGIELRFADGSLVPTGLVVAGDGIHSAVREILLPESTPRPTGYAAIYGKTILAGERCALIPEPLIGSGVTALGERGYGFFFTTMGFGALPRPTFDRAHLVIPPLPEANYVMWALIYPRPALPANLFEQSPEALHRLARAGAADYHPFARSIVAQADIASTIAVELVAATRPTRLPALPVAFMGDALHGMPPFGAHGGNTALRDAALLATHLIGAREANRPLESTLGAYHRQVMDYAFKEVAAAEATMKRSLEGPAPLRWVMQRLVPAIRKITGRTTLVIPNGA